MFDSTNPRASALILTVVFLLLCVAKVVFVTTPAIGPTIFGDELLYRQFAWRLYNFEAYGSGQYPLAYPLFLAPSFLFGDNFYEAMKVSNALASSLTIFPIFLISKLFLSREESLLVAAASALMPFHYVFPQLIMSENIWLPLLLFGLYLALRRPTANTVVWDIATGAVAGTLYLTRHISLVVVAALAFTWLVTNFERGARPFIRGTLIIIVAAAIYSPWVLIQVVFAGTSLKNTLGFGIASRTNPDQLTLELLMTWAVLYAAYFVLLTSTNLPFLFSAAARTIRTRKIFENRLLIGVLLILGLMALAVTRHSWRAYYNYPEMRRIMGRYLICFPILFSLVAAVEAKRLQELKRGARWAALYVLPSIILMGLSYAVIFYDGIADIDLDVFMTDRGAIDGFAIKLIGFFWTIIFLASMAAIAFVARFKPQRLFVAVVTITALINVLNLAVYYRQFDSYHTFSAPARTIFENAPREVVGVYVDNSVHQKFLKNSLTFWGVKATVYPISAYTASNPGAFATTFFVGRAPGRKGIPVVGRYKVGKREMVVQSTNTDIK